MLYNPTKSSPVTTLAKSSHTSFLFLIQLGVLSGAAILFFHTFWSATVFLPFSIGAEILAKFLFARLIEHFVHHHRPHHHDIKK